MFLELCCQRCFCCCSVQLTPPQISQKICTVCETVNTQVLRRPYSSFSSSCVCNDPKLPTRVMRFVTVWWLLLMIRVTCISYSGTVGMLPLCLVQPPVSCRFRILIFSVDSIKKATNVVSEKCFMPSVFAFFYLFIESYLVFVEK